MVQSLVRSWSTITNHREMPQNEIEIMDGEAKIFTNDFDIWQFRMWIREEKKHVRKSLKTKDKERALLEARKLYVKLLGQVESGQKLFGEKIELAIQPYLNEKRSQIGLGDETTIVEGRYNTIATHLRHFCDYIGRGTKITDLDTSMLIRYTRDGEQTNYIQFRRNEGVKDVTIYNEMSTVGSCFTHLFELGHTSIRKVQFPKKNKIMDTVDRDAIRRQTFTRDEYKKFSVAMRSSYVALKKNNLKETDDEWYDRQLARHYFQFAVNSGMRSGELRQMRWEDVDIVIEKNEDGKERKLARVVVPALNTKVRKFRKFFCMGGEYIERWGKEYARHKTGLIFSRDGETELHNSFFNRHFRRVLAISKIDKERQKVLVPYSIRHYCITSRYNAGCRFEDIAQMCGTSVKQIENTYLHLSEEMMKATALRKNVRYEYKEGIPVPLVDLLGEASD
jgi:integrase